MEEEWSSLANAGAAMAASARGKTSLVFGLPREFGYCPHPGAKVQERDMERAGVDGEVAMCIASVMAGGHIAPGGNPDAPKGSIMRYFGVDHDGWRG